MAEKRTALIFLCRDPTVSSMETDDILKLSEIGKKIKKLQKKLDDLCNYVDQRIEELHKQREEIISQFDFTV
ncbi:hypothetical protein SUGI_0437930 [Cryptomeria japonica]|nr:hypothetical protein SUGI_0437930 [Cryptomeria japonica]